MAKTHLHENTVAPCRFLYSLHSTGINSSGAAQPPILNCNNPSRAYKGQWRRVYMVVGGGAESSKSEFGTTALSFKTNPQSGLQLASELPISKGINFQQTKTYDLRQSFRHLHQFHSCVQQQQPWMTNMDSKFMNRLDQKRSCISTTRSAENAPFSLLGPSAGLRIFLYLEFRSTVKHPPSFPIQFGSPKMLLMTRT